MQMNYPVIKKLISQGRSISTMESCTGGFLASTISDCSGASDIYPGGYVTYSNRGKIMAGVPAETIDKYGVYSRETAEAMARACAEAYGAEIGVGVTGSLGRKDPQNPDSVVGKVFYSIYTNDEYITVGLTVPDEITERAEMKRWIVNDILEKLEETVCDTETDGNIVS